MMRIRRCFAAAARGALLVALLVGAGAARAQTATLNGFVIDRADRQPIELVNIALRDDAGTLRGTVTDRDGVYLVTRLTPGRYVITASFVGYASVRDTLVLEPDENRTFNIELGTDEGALGEVLVQTERESGAARVTAGQQTIRPADLELIPVPDASADLAGYLSTLPGVISTGDRGGQLFIRGGEPTQNLVQLDGILLYQPFHVLGFYSAFPADILNRSDIYAGGYGAKFGERISSVIDIWTRDGNKRRYAGTGSISPFIGTVSLEGPLIRDKVSFLVSGRQSLLEQGAEKLVDQNLPFNFNDFFGKMHAELTPRSRFSMTALSTNDRGTLVEDLGGVEPEEVRWSNRAIGGRYLLLPRKLSISADLRFSHSRYDSELGPVNDPSRTSSIWNTAITFDSQFSGARANTEAGFALRLISSATELGGAFQNTEFKGVGIDHLAFYLEPEYKLGALRVRPGIRLQWYYLRVDPYLEPRLRIVYNAGRHQFSAAGGYYLQEIVGLNDRRDAASVFTAWTNIPRLNPRQPDVLAERVPSAIHAIAGYRVEPVDGFELSVEGFHKWLDNLFISEWTAFPRFTTRLQPASGTSYGFETRIELRRPKFYSVVNYGYSNTRYTANQASLLLWYGEETLSFRPPHDRRHQVNALISTEIAGFDLSARWEFGSGLPFSRALGFDGFVLVNDVIDVTEAPSTRRVIYERPYRGVLPTYHRLDLSIDRTFTYKNASMTVLGSMINVYDRRNLFYLDVFTLRRVDQLPFVPSFGLKVTFE
ncbi:MAG: TonB-dependent receptor [Rhodothermales bacterium]